jgi:hypothetical protein
MRLNRSLGVASNPESAGGHRVGAGVVRTLSVAAVAAAACALSALPALASTAAGTTATTTTITSPNPTVAANAGVAVPLTANVASNSGGATPTGTVTFTPTNLPAPIPSNLICTATLNSAGVGTCNVTPATGTWGFVLYEATYSGDTTYAGSTSTGEHKVITWDITSTTLTFNPSTATVNKPDTLTATVTDQPKDSLAKAAGGPDQVTFSIGGTAIPGCSNVNVTDPSNGPDNVATCTYTPTATGSVSIKAAYLGDDYALPSSATETLTVTSATVYSTKTTVSVNPKTANPKQLVTLSATVTSTTTPTGTVTFWVSTRKLCVAKLSGGKGSCTAAFPNPGPKTIVGDYSGDSTHKTSSGSAPLTIK